MIQPNSLHEEQPPMLDIIIVFTCLSQYLAPTTLRQLHRVTEAMLSMTGRVTMKGLSRWTDQGGSYRTVQRFFNTSISWCKLQWVLIRHHLLEPDDVIVMGGDEVVVTKSGTLIGSRALAAYDDVDGPSAANNRPGSRKCTARLLRRPDASASARGCGGTRRVRREGAGNVD